MGKGKKSQIVALVDPAVRTQLDTLRIVTQSSRARVIEDLLDEALAARLKVGGVKRDIARVRALAAAAGQTLEDYVAAYAVANARETYGPSLDELEAGSALGE